MKMRIAGRARQVQGEKGMIVYRRGGLLSSETLNVSPFQGRPKPRISICQPEKSGVIPAGISRERYLLGKVYQLAKRKPEPTKLEPVELLVPCRLED